MCKGGVPYRELSKMSGPKRCPQTKDRVTKNVTCDEEGLFVNREVGTWVCCSSATEMNADSSREVHGGAAPVASIPLITLCAGSWCWSAWWEGEQSHWKVEGPEDSEVLWLTDCSAHPGSCFLFWLYRLSIQLQSFNYMPTDSSHSVIKNY